MRARRPVGMIGGVLATSHAIWTWRLTRGRPRRGWLVLGSVLPDLPAIALGAAHLARGRPPADLLEAVYHRSPAREVQLAAHSVLGPAALLAAGRGRPLAAGWLGHVAVDLLTHADDAWPPLWPLARVRWPSPVSYWQPARHARAFALAEVAAHAAALALGRARGRGERAVGAVAAVLAAGPLLSGRRDVLRRAGLAPDPSARARDLAPTPAPSAAPPDRASRAR